MVFSTCILDISSRYQLSVTQQHKAQESISVNLNEIEASERLEVIEMLRQAGARSAWSVCPILSAGVLRGVPYHYAGSAARPDP